MQEKKFTGYLLLHWKTGKVRIVKNKPTGKTINPFEIPVLYNVKIKMPEIKDVPMELEVDLPIVDTSNLKF